MSVTELYQSGIMREMLDRGLITPSTFRSLELFMEVKDLELLGYKRTHAVEEAATKCKASERSIWRAIRKIEA